MSKSGGVRKQREREKRFLELTDKLAELIGRAMEAESVDTKDLKQITGAMKDLRELIWERETKTETKSEPMVIKIEGDVE